MQRATLILIATSALLCIRGIAYAEGGFKQPAEMVRRSEFVAIVTIDDVTPLPHTEQPIWTFGQRAHATVEQNIKGALPRAVDIYGGENFVCQETVLSPGRYLAFLCRYPRGELASVNYQMGIRPIHGDRVEWYYDNGRGTLSPNFGYGLRWKRLDSILRRISDTPRPNHAMERTADRS